MEEVKLTILGCGSALPTKKNFHTSQLLEMRNKQFLIDCGEGTQIRIRQFNIKTNRLKHIFISHLHGDHCFGLPGLISSLGMMGRTADIEIHAHPDLEKLIAPQIAYSCGDFPFKVNFHPFNPRKCAVIYEDKSVKVTTIPLKHRVPTCGFLFEEQPKSPHLLRSMIDAYEIPIRALAEIKEGADYVTPDDEIVPNNRLTTPADPPKRFAYCSDTAYNEKIIPIIEGVDCLYHESTFLEEDVVRIKKTLHSSAKQAALIAQKAHVGKLIIGHYSARYKTNVPFVTEAKSIFFNTFPGEDGSSFLI
ncbi:MAG: ribonuclease Z [Sphingobacteriia bacterium]|jgi:ribonuclease Z|nr:ribonuclease Z [Paludibacteraceae bacterium]NCA80074.1 ribonuclease Z [Sphingobacteriia bacterium]